MTTNKPPTQPLPRVRKLVLAPRIRRTLSPRGILILRIVLALVTVAAVVLHSMFPVLAPVFDGYTAMWEGLIDWIFLMMNELTPTGKGW